MVESKDEYKQNETQSVVGVGEVSGLELDLDDKLLLDNIMAKWFKADNWFESNMRARFEYCRDASISYLRDKNNWVTSNPIFDPTSEKIANALIAKYMIGLFSKGGDIDFDLDYTGLVDPAQAKAIKHMMKSMIKKSPNMAETMLDFIRQLVIYGTAVFEVVWEQTDKKIKVIKRDEEGNPIIKKGKVQFEIKEARTYEGIKFALVDVVNEFRIDPDATSIDGFDKFRKIWITKAQLKEKEKLGIYTNIDKIKGQATDKNNGLNRSYDNLNPQPITPPRLINDDELVEVIEYWSADDSMRIAVANRNMIITPKDDRYNPFFHGTHPFVSSVFTKLDTQFYGRGAMEMCKPQQTLLNLLQNLDIEEALRHICRMYKVREGSGPRSETLVFAPDKMIPVQEIDDLVPMEQAPYDLQSINKMQSLKQDAEEITGATRQSAAMGADSSRRTATESVLLNKMGSELHALHIWTIDQLGLIRAIDLAYRLVLQCAKKELYMKYGEDAVLEVDPVFLPYEVKFVPRIGFETMSKEMVLQYLTQFLQSVGSILVQSGQPLDVNKLASFYLETAGIKAEEIGLSKVQPQQVQQGGQLGQASPVMTQNTPNPANVQTPTPTLPPVSGGMMGGQNA